MVQRASSVIKAILVFSLEQAARAQKFVNAISGMAPVVETSSRGSVCGSRPSLVDNTNPNPRISWGNCDCEGTHGGHSLFMEPVGAKKHSPGGRTNVRFSFVNNTCLRLCAMRHVQQRSLTMWMAIMTRMCQRIPAHIVTLESMYKSCGALVGTIAGAHPSHLKLAHQNTTLG